MTIAENICPVVSNEAVNSEYRLLVVDAPPVALAAEAGQFFHLACPAHADDLPLLRRPMSVYNVDRAHARMSFLYKVTSPGTRGLARLVPGDALDALGPLGRGFRISPDTKHVLMLGRGVGLATLAPLAGLALSQAAKVTAVLSARSPEFLMSADYFRGLGAETVAVTDTAGDSGVEAVKARLREIHARSPIDFLATCGSNRLLLLLQEFADEWSIPGEVALEQHMGCGLGMCYACVRPFRTADGGQDYRRVCWDGPVFDIKEAMTWLT